MRQPHDDNREDNCSLGSTVVLSKAGLNKYLHDVRNYPQLLKDKVDFLLISIDMCLAQ